MKLTLLTQNLKSAVNFVSRLTQKSISLPILNNILIKTDSNLLELAATNLEIGIQCWVLSKIDKEGQIAIPSKVLSSLLNSLPVKEDKLDLEIKDLCLFLKGKNFSTKIIGNNADDFPLIPKISEKFCKIDSNIFLEGLSQVVDFTALNQIKPELFGVFIHFSPQLITMAASDSFRLAEKKIFLNEKINEKEKSIILPQKTAKELILVLENSEAKECEIFLSENQVMFEFKSESLGLPRIQITSQLIEGFFPNYQEIIPKEIQTRVIFDKEEFLENLKSASSFIGKTNEVNLTIDPESKKIIVFSQNSDVGDYQSDFPAKIEGEKIKISFNYRFLLEGVLKIKSREVVFDLSGKETPALLKPVGFDDYFYIVMPLKLN
jgi:DNA polymerase-3 subunit beta